MYLKLLSVTLHSYSSWIYFQYTLHPCSVQFIVLIWALYLKNALYLFFVLLVAMFIYIVISGNEIRLMNGVGKRRASKLLCSVLWNVVNVTCLQIEQKIRCRYSLKNDLSFWAILFVLINELFKKKWKQIINRSSVPAEFWQVPTQVRLKLGLFCCHIYAVTFSTQNVNTALLFMWL